MIIMYEHYLFRAVGKYRKNDTNRIFSWFMDESLCPSLGPEP